MQVRKGWRDGQHTKQARFSALGASTAQRGVSGGDGHEQQASGARHIISNVSVHNRLPVERA